MKNEESLKELIRQGFAAMKAGSHVAKTTTDATADVATNPKLKQALEDNEQQSKEWAKRIDRGLEEAGGAPEQRNLILEAAGETGKKTNEQMPDDFSRDLGLIAIGQLALHYWISAFGTMVSYTTQAGLEQASKEMQTCLTEAKKSDERYTEIAKAILSAN
ncbi:MAG: DUF892 family protein [Chryseobacterium sp.]|nr:MAG: DUF892 family protein [Chryseobacterium sp.]